MHWNILILHHAKLFEHPILYLRSVWIELILLKLKTENWKHGNKIIFKCVNSAAGPILVWVWILVHVFSSNAFSIFFFFFCVSAVVVDQFSYALFMDPQTSLFSNFFIKNGSHSIIYTFKNYFVTVFSVFSFNKISYIQTNLYCLPPCPF